MDGITFHITTNLRNYNLLDFPSGSDKNLPAMREAWVRSLGWEDPLKEGTAMHSSILAWKKSPWTEEPGGLPFMGAQRV